MVPGDSAGHSNQRGTTGGTVLDTNMVTGCGLGPGHLCGLWWQHGLLDINRDPSCGRTTDPDMVFSSSPGLDATMAQMSSQVTQISMAPMALWLLDTNMTTGSGLDHRPLHSPQ